MAGWYEENQHPKLKTIFILSPWLEALLYGVYVCLFIGALPLLVRKGAPRSQPRVFVVAIVLMFVLISIHIATSISLMVDAFGYETDVDSPLAVITDMFTSWIPYTGTVVAAIVNWVGDFIVIYRCFLVWQRKYRVIIVPCLLSFISIVLHSANLYWARNFTGGLFSALPARPLIILPFVFYFLQNALTTGLIVYRIWSQFRHTQCDVRLVSMHTPSLVSIVRIIIESAVIYTGALLVMVIVLCLDHPTLYMAYCCQVQITGITFVLMVVRIHAVREEAKNTPANTASMMPTWLIGEQGSSKGNITTRREYELDLSRHSHAGRLSRAQSN